MDCGNVTAAALVNRGAVAAEADVAPAIEKTAVRRAIVWRPNRKGPIGDAAVGRADV